MFDLNFKEKQFFFFNSKNELKEKLMFINIENDKKKVSIFILTLSLGASMGRQKLVHFITSISRSRQASSR